MALAESRALDAQHRNMLDDLWTLLLKMPAFQARMAADVGNVFSVFF